MSSAFLEATEPKVFTVIPAEAGIQSSSDLLDPGFRRGDEEARTDRVTFGQALTMAAAEIKRSAEDDSRIEALPNMCRRQ